MEGIGRQERKKNWKDRIDGFDERRGVEKVGRKGIDR